MRTQLEDFMIPLIKKEIDVQKLIFSKNDTKYVIEAPTFFEVNGLQVHLGKFIIMVQTDKDIRVQRILDRNKHLSIQDVLDRISNQINPSEKIEFCDYVIWNNGTPDELRLEIKDIIQKIE